jgi:cytidine deaminase
MDDAVMATAARGQTGKVPGDDTLLDRARQVARNGYAPYSGFHVGCALETIDGDVFTGTNMENASYGLGMCAEVGALLAAAAAGALERVARIVVAGGRISEDGALGGDAIVTPCGRCRQLIFEAAQLGGRDIGVTCASGSGTASETLPISQLLPYAFGPADVADPPEQK